MKIILDEDDARFLLGVLTDHAVEHQDKMESFRAWDIHSKIRDQLANLTPIETKIDD